MNERVSIIIPTYQRKISFLERATNSVLNQTYKNVEVIIVDDNGGTKTKEYREQVKEWIKNKRDERVVYLPNERNIGASKSRNRGIQIATGSYITFLDDDDRYLPQKIERQLTYMLDHQLEVCFSDLVYHDESESVVDVRVHTKLKSLEEKELLAYHLTRHITGTPTFMYQKHVLEEVGGFPNQSIAEEYHLMQKTIEGHYRIGYLSGVDVVAYRHQETGLSSGEEKLKGEEALYKFKKNHFDILSRRQRRFIRFRHYSVVAIFYKRKRKIMKSIICFFYAACISPVDALAEGGRLAVRIKKYR